MEMYKILQALQNKRNVLLMGAPGTGKSKYMNDVANAFVAGVAPTAHPTHTPGAAIPIPATPATNTLGVLPMLQRQNRKVFRTTLHQNSKYRDFLTGITPRLDGTEGYQINEGIIYRANEFAKQPNSAALLILDELNRGPAIEVFGGSIVALENDKRLSDDNTPTRSTQYFEIIAPDGEYVEYAFSPHLYILAAMNQADVSVAPLDVAFLRRWQTIMLNPDYLPIYEKFQIDAAAQIPDTATNAAEVYLVAIKALEKINEKITIGRGAEYQLGQGVFLSTEPRGNTLGDALEFVCECWSMIYSHIEELFFGDPNAIAYILNAELTESPYNLEEVSFAGESKYRLSHAEITKDNVFALYRSLIGG